MVMRILVNCLFALVILVAPLGDKGLEAISQVTGLEITGGCYVYDDDASTVMVEATGRDSRGYWKVTGIMRWGLLIHIDRKRVERDI